MSRFQGHFLAVLLLTIAIGCGSSPAPEPPPTTTQAPSPEPEQQPVAEKKAPLPVRSKLREVGRAEEMAMKKVTTAITESLDIGPTLAVWLIDRTPSAKDIVREVSAAAQNFYESPEVAEWSAAEDKPLLTAIMTFDDKVYFDLDPPTSDPKNVLASFDSIKPSSASREMTFTAIKQALEKYLPLRTGQRRELVIVVVTDEAGDDAKILDEIIEPTRRQAIPIYAIGLPAPWGQTNPFAKDPKAAEPSKDDSIPSVGPESTLSERVDIDNWNARNFTGTITDLVDSGFGPFALERLCRESRGQFFALRPGLGYGYRAVSEKSWPNGNELRFDDQAASKYAPDYVSEAEYQKLLAENKACSALCEAARLPKVTMEGTPGSRFPKDAEAEMAKQMSAAQQFAARNLPPVDRLYEVLAKGETDRAKLTSPRWQAEFDLAIGRAAANKARLDGYNSMIAALKRGKSFQNSASKAWLLESADNFETESTIKKLAEKAKMYLDRVVHEHPGTPWAKIAEEELKLPLGWSWKETTDGGAEPNVKAKKGK